MLGRPAQQSAGQAGDQPEQAQLQRVEPKGLTTRQAQAAQQGTGIEAPGGEARGGQRDRHASQQHRSETGEVQILFGAAQGAADLAIAVLGGLQPLVWLQIGFHGLAIAFEIGRRATP